MPIVDGLTVCKVLRADGNRVPILMLTARTETRDRVAGLDAGADDYLPKPFELDELLARLRALLRRAQHRRRRPTPTWSQLADLRLDPAARRAWRGDRELDLSKTEFDLLELLVRNQGVVLDHSTIYDRIWHYDFGPDSKNLAVYIGYLRRKTEAEGEARLIQTVRGVGYSARRGPGRRVRLMSLRLAHRARAGGDRRRRRRSRSASPRTAPRAAPAEEVDSRSYEAWRNIEANPSNRGNAELLNVYVVQIVPPATDTRRRSSLGGTRRARSGPGQGARTTESL